MLYNYHDIYIGRSLDFYGEWAWEEIELTESYARGGIVIDVGAHIGTHTLCYARVASLVFAIEPQYVMLQTLMANLALNCIENVRPHFGAAGNRDGSTQIPWLNYAEDNSFGSVRIGTGTSTIPMIRLDSLDIDPQLIKIDAEGSEIQIIQGAVETIQRCRPVLYIENDRPEYKETLRTLIESFGYTCQWHTPWLYNPANFYEIQENIFPNLWSENMLCLPSKGR